MFYINQNTPHFLAARRQHYLAIRFIIKKKMLGSRFTEAHPPGWSGRIQPIANIDSAVAAFLSDESNLTDVLIGSPEKLDQIKAIYTNRSALDSIEKLFSYDAFISKSKNSPFRHYNAYHLAEGLRQNTCIYCNRLYTNTIITKKVEYIARPTFDHWFPKSRFPLLALSFYNLIPSCSVCNTSVKGSGVYPITETFHPYWKQIDLSKQLDVRFSYNLSVNSPTEVKIIANNAFTDDSITKMKLREIYSVHTEEVDDLLYLRRAYADSYMDSLRNLLNMNLTDSEVYRLAFGAYLEEDQLGKRPLSKLKKDILTELGIIR